MRLALTAIVIAFAAAALMAAPSNVDPTNFRAWGENVGWMNWRDAGSPNGSSGINVGDRFLAGFVWSENVGWISLGNGAPVDGLAYANLNATDYGVNVDSATGKLSGLAWGENVGWINFSTIVAGDTTQPPQFRCDGRLTGLVWAENIGWINLSLTQPGQFVALDTASRPLACDMNRDGRSDGRDVQRFIDVLLFGGASWREACSGDLEPMPDGGVDMDDVTSFVQCLMAG